METYFGSAHRVLADRLHSRCWFVAFVVNGPVVGCLNGRHLETDRFGHLYGLLLTVLSFELVFPVDLNLVANSFFVDSYCVQSFIHDTEWPLRASLQLILCLRLLSLMSDGCQRWPLHLYKLFLLEVWRRPYFCLKALLIASSVSCNAAEALSVTVHIFPRSYMRSIWNCCCKSVGWNGRTIVICYWTGGMLSRCHRKLGSFSCLMCLRTLHVCKQPPIFIPMILMADKITYFFISIYVKLKYLLTDCCPLPDIIAS